MKCTSKIKTTLNSYYEVENNPVCVHEAIALAMLAGGRTCWTKTVNKYSAGIKIHSQLYLLFFEIFKTCAFHIYTCSSVHVIQTNKKKRCSVMYESV